MATHETEIAYFLPGDGHLPEGGVDSTSGLAYSAWEVDDEGRFSFRVPDTFTSGVDLMVRIAWSTPSASANHQWQMVSTLLRPGVSATDVETWEETDSFSDETSSSTANTLTESELTICTNGQIDGEEIDPGDIVSVTLSRVAADNSEDANPIKVFVCTVVIDGTDAAPTGYTGSRLEGIEQRVRLLMNDDNDFFRTDAQFLACVNAGLRRIASEGYWKKETSVTTTTSAEYDLTTVATDIVTLYRVRWYEDDSYSTMKRITSWKEYRDVVSYDTYSYGRPMYWFQAGTTLWLHPAASEVVTGGLILFHSYKPDDLNFTTNFAPEFPEAFDDVLVYWCMWMLAERDFTRPGSTPQSAQAWRVQFETELGRLVGIPGLSARPGR